MQAGRCEPRSSSNVRTSKCRVTIHTARPGVIIGKKGADIETLRKKLANMTDSELLLNIVEVRKPELDAAACRRKHRPAAGTPGHLSAAR